MIPQIQGLLATSKIIAAGVLLTLAAWIGWHIRGVVAERDALQKTATVATAAVVRATEVRKTTEVQQKETADASSSYQQRLAAINRGYDSRLRGNASDAGTTELSVRPLPDASGGSDDPSPQQFTCPAPERSDIYLELEARAAGDALQLQELQAWITRQQEIMNERNK